MTSRYAKKNHAPVRYAWGVAGLIVLFPFSLAKVDFRSGFSHGIAVAAHRSSPAYAAFEDMTGNFKSEATVFPEKMELLAAGQAVDLQSIRKIVQQRQITLHGMTVRAPSLEPQPIYVAGERMKATPVPASDYHDPQGTILAEAPTMAEMANQLILQEVKATTPNRRIIQTDSGSPVMIGGHLDKTPRSKENENHVEAQDPSISTPPVPTMASLHSPDGMGPLWLNGTIEMTGGLAYVGPETQMVVKRTLDGETYERGRIWVTEGKFEIYVKNPVGVLVAELLTRDGRILGRGEMSLMSLGEIPSRHNRIYNIRLALRPTTDGARFPVISGYSHGQQKMPVREARVEIESYGNIQTVDEDGVASEPDLDRESTFVVRAQAKRHWPTLMVGQSGTAQDIRLFSDSLVRALIGLTLDQYDQRAALEQGVVWGKVSRAGEPVSGVEVEMAGDGRAIYFNELNGMFMPDPKLKTTAANGLFAFLKVKPGVQAIRVKDRGRIHPAQIFLTEAKHVSYVEADIRDKMVSRFKAMDVLDPKRSVNARLKIAGSDEVLRLEDQGYVKYSVAANPFMIEAEAGLEYEITRMTLAGTPQLVQIPLVKREWLLDLQRSAGVLDHRGRGTILGFIDDSDYEIEVTGYGPQDHIQMVYFDRSGRPLNTHHGVAGGGFAVFNAPSGLQTVYIHPTQSRETHGQVVVTEPGYVHVIAWSASKRKK
jgi:hypothetical protein